jgi:DNA-binding beta-propeller fold protein YncE
VSVEGTTDGDGAVVIVDTLTRRPIGRIGIGAFGPHWFVVSPDGTRGYASNKEAPFVSVLDLVEGELIDKIEVPGSEGLAVSGDGAHLYVAAPYAAFGGSESAASPGVRVIDTKRRSVIDVLETESIAVPVHLTVTGKVLAGEVRMAPDVSADPSRREPGLVQIPGQLTVFSADTHERLGGLEIGRCPLTITSSPDGGWPTPPASSTHRRRHRPRSPATPGPA